MPFFGDIPFLATMPVLLASNCAFGFGRKHVAVEVRLVDPAYEYNNNKVLTSLSEID